MSLCKTFRLKTSESCQVHPCKHSQWSVWHPVEINLVHRFLRTLLLKLLTELWDNLRALSASDEVNELWQVTDFLVHNSAVSQVIDKRLLKLVDNVRVLWGILAEDGDDMHSLLTMQLLLRVSRCQKLNSLTIPAESGHKLACLLLSLLLFKTFREVSVNLELFLPKLEHFEPKSCTQPRFLTFVDFLRQRQVQSSKWRLQNLFGCPYALFFLLLHVLY